VVPCRFVRLSHWHCSPKTHFGKQRMDHPTKLRLINAALEVLERHGHGNGHGNGPSFGRPLALPAECDFGMAIDAATECAPGNCGGVDTSPRRRV
jgi:hypothetical protein